MKLGLASSQWDRWSKNNIEKNSFFLINSDWRVLDIVSKTNNGRPSRDYWVTIEFAKHLCMMARTQRAHDYRNYFLECEKVALSEQRQFPRISDAEYNKKFGTLCDKLNNRDKIITSQIKACEALHGLAPKDICQEYGVRTARGSADELSRLARTAIEDMVALAPDEDVEKTVIAAADMVLNLINKGNKLPYVPTFLAIAPRQPRARLTVQLELF